MEIMSVMEVVRSTVLVFSWLAMVPLQTMEFSDLQNQQTKDYSSSEKIPRKIDEVDHELDKQIEPLCKEVNINELLRIYNEAQSETQSRIKYLLRIRGYLDDFINNALHICKADTLVQLKNIFSEPGLSQSSSSVESSNSNKVGGLADLAVQLKLNSCIRQINNSK